MDAYLELIMKNNQLHGVVPGWCWFEGQDVLPIQPHPLQGALEDLGESHRPLQSTAWSPQIR